jgi:general L-amino acid transport system permease protein
MDSKLQGRVVRSSRAASEMIAARSAPPPVSSWSLQSQAFRSKLFQAILILLLIAVAVYLVHNTTENMRLRGIQSGYGFLLQPAGFDIGETMLAYDSGNPYWKAILVGLSNTVRVALLGILLSTLIGTAVGIGRFSRNMLLRALCQVYVEFFRNVPVLLQLLMWYLLLTELLPAPNEPWVFGAGFYLSKGGFNFPLPDWAWGHASALAGLLVGLVVLSWWRRKQLRRFEETGEAASLWLAAVLCVSMGTMLGWMAGGAPSTMRYPEMGAFAIDGGGALTPEFLAVLIGLTLYTAGFIAEVVRAGIQSVPRGQGEAAQSLGLCTVSRDAPCSFAASTSSDYSATYESVSESDQEFVACRCNRLPGCRLDSQYLNQPDWPGGGMYIDHYDCLSEHFIEYVSVYELV